MKLGGNALLLNGIRAIALVALCIIVVDVTQLAAMAVLVGFHELGHTLTGISNGERLTGLPSVTFTGLFPQDVRGLTPVDNNTTATMEAQQARSKAGPFVTLILGILLAALLYTGTKVTNLLKKGRYAGYIVEALILLTFWSGWAIVSQFIRSEGTDFGSATANGIVGEGLFFVAVLIGVMIMTSFTLDRFLKYFVIIGDVRGGKGSKLKIEPWIRYTAYLSFSILVAILGPLAPQLAAYFFGWLFMIMTVGYYIALLLTDKYNLSKVGQDLDRPSPTD